MKDLNSYKLAELSESVRYGYTASATHEEIGPHFLRITDIVTENIDWHSVPYCKIEDRLKEKYLLKKGDIIVARTGATVGYAKYIREDVDAVFASYLVRFRLDSSKADPCYVGQLVQSDIYKSFVKSRIGGAAQPNASAPVLGDFPIILPPLPVQTRIADILSAYDDLIENNKRRMALLEASARELYREWFVRLRFPGHENKPVKNGLPHGWKRKKLGELFKQKKETISPDQIDASTPYIGLEHIPRRSITLCDWETAEKVTSTKYRFAENDVLFGKIRPYFHKVGFAMNEGITSSDTILMQPIEERLFAFLLMTASSDEFVAYVSQTVKEGSKMPRADVKMMKAYDIALPSDKLVASFNAAVLEITQQLKNLTLQNQKLRQARDLLLPKLMNGEIEV